MHGVLINMYRVILLHGAIIAFINVTRSGEMTR